MPQLQNLVLTDRTPVTPVDHTFTPFEVRDNVGSVVKTTGVPIGDPRATVSMKRNGANKYKGQFRLSMPVVQDEDLSAGLPAKVVRTAYADLTFTFDDTSTEQERKNIIGMVADALDPAQTLVNDAFVKLQGVY